MTRRPILDPAARTHRIELRLTEVERHSLDRAAATAHASSTSEWARQVLLGAAESAGSLPISRNRQGK